MKKNTLNYIIDIIMFILMMTLIGIGFLMKYILITGQERWIKYGRNVEETFLGLDRHGWGKVHLIIGLTLFAVLVLHLILHWKSITRFFKNAFANRALRISFVTILLLVSAGLVIFPFFVKTELAELETGYGRLYRERTVTNREPSVANRDASLKDVSQDTTAPGVKPESMVQDKPVAEEDHQLKRLQREALKVEIDVQGYMTLREVSTRYNVSADQIKESIGIPLGTSNNERLGQLRRRYGFTMSDVREAIEKEQQK